MAGTGGDENVRREILRMIRDCEWMNDEVTSLEVRSAVAHDGVVFSLVPYLLELSLLEEDVVSVRRRMIGVKNKQV